MTTLTKNNLFILLAFLCMRSPVAAQQNVQDSFETPQLSKIWSTDRMVKNAFEIQSTIVRHGQSAAKITLHTGDMHEAGIGKSKDSERDELREATGRFSAENKIYEYQFSLFLPDSFPIVPTRLVIAQWKQRCPDDSSCSDDSPVMAVRYVSGKLYITLNTDSGAKTIYQTKEEVRNKWLDFKFNVCFSRLSNGWVNIWLNEKQITSFKGITCYSSQKGYNSNSYFYFKMGLYRDVMPVPMTIYIDDYSKKEIKIN
jgi:hypothetical protein